MFRYLLWRLLGVLAVLAGTAALAWLLGGGPGRVLRGGNGRSATRGMGHGSEGFSLAEVPGLVVRAISGFAGSLPGPLLEGAILLLAFAAAAGLILLCCRWRARRRRRYVRLRVEAYRADSADPIELARMFTALHGRSLERWWRRLLRGQPSFALEAHCGEPERRDRHDREMPGGAWLGLVCPHGQERGFEAALQVAYPNSRLVPVEGPAPAARVVMRLKKRRSFLERTATAERAERAPEPPMNRLLTALAACGEPRCGEPRRGEGARGDTGRGRQASPGAAFVQLALTPAPLLFERIAHRAFRRREDEISRRRRDGLATKDRSTLLDSELRGGLEVQHRALFFTDIRVVGSSRTACEQVAAVLRVQRGENQLVERGTAFRHGLLGLYDRRVRRGEGNPLAGISRSVFSPDELALLWQLPSIDYATVPFARAGVPLAPAPPAIMRPAGGRGLLRDALGPVTIHPGLRRQNTAVPGTVEQGKSSYLVATVAEDLRRESCAVIVLDPKGDAADAAISVVPDGRLCTLLDFAHPTCGFNPLDVDAPADVIADYVVGALKNLFTDADIRASSDRFLRNATIAVLAHDRGASLWDAARLLSVGEEGYAYRRAVAARVRGLPELKEISSFFTAELTAQLADARSATTAKLDAPVNKLARLLNSASIKRVLLNSSLSVDFDRIIADREVLIVKGALGAMGAGNTSVLMQLLVGMLDAALARQQDLRSSEQRTAVALKIDEAPLVLNRGFAETMALKRSAGLETVACWQTDSQWTDREVHDQLDALFAHRVYFATASARDARDSVALTMSEFSDTVRPDTAHLAALGRPDVRLRLPKHHAIVSWTTPAGRQPAFVAQTLPMRVDPERIAAQAAQQRARGGRHLTDMRQPHWDAPAGTVLGSRPAATGREEPVTDGAAAHPLVQAPARARLTELPPAPAPSYAELVALDSAHSIRAASSRVVRPLERIDELDLQILALVARLGHLLSSQLHRRFNTGRAATTTQRRLKRLADAQLVTRLQFHRRDGGGMPMCYAIAPEGRRLLIEHEPTVRAARSGDPVREAAQAAQAGRQPDRLTAAPGEPAARRGGPIRQLAQARRDVHVAGWVLALAELLASGDALGADVPRRGRRARLEGGEEAAIETPRTPPGRPRPFAPEDLRLPSGRVPHDFLRTVAPDQRIEAEGFETIRPHARISSPQQDERPRLEVLVERDDRQDSLPWVSKLERYDHFLSGWALHTRRYGIGSPLPTVVFLCRDRARAAACAGKADQTLLACRAYAGEYPPDWEYWGRRQILFAAERDIHERAPCALGVPPLPPAVREQVAGGAGAEGGATAAQPPLCVRTII